MQLQNYIGIKYHVFSHFDLTRAGVPSSHPITKGTHPNVKHNDIYTIDGIDGNITMLVRICFVEIKDEQADKTQEGQGPITEVNCKFD